MASPWTSHSAKLVAVPQWTCQQLCQCTESAASRCAGSSGCPFLWWLCVGDTCLDPYPPRHPCDAKGSNRLRTRKKLTSVSFPSNNGGLPRLSSSWAALHRPASKSSSLTSDSWLLLWESQFCCHHLLKPNTCVDHCWSLTFWDTLAFASFSVGGIVVRSSTEIPAR